MDMFISLKVLSVATSIKIYLGGDVLMECSAAKSGFESSSRGHKFISQQSCPVAHSHLQLQLQGIRHPLLDSKGTCAQVLMSIHTHIYTEFFKSEMKS